MKSKLLITIAALGSVLVLAQKHRGHVSGSSPQKRMSAASMPDACKRLMAKREEMMPT